VPAATTRGALLSSTPVMCNFANHDLLADRGIPMRTGLITAALMLIPAAAFAHAGAGEAHGFASGFAHPLGGLDHILAMVTVGIFAWQLGGRALWLVPGSFVLAMTAGAALGMAGVALPFVEFGVAASVIVLGGVVAFARGAPIAIAIGVVALFAIFHGHAHGTEMPLDATGGAYAAGFMLATALLHAAGIALGCAIGRVADGRAGYRLGGSLVALAGLAILSTMI
jgi:urease accessory protein